MSVEVRGMSVEMREGVDVGFGNDDGMGVVTLCAVQFAMRLWNAVDGEQDDSF